MSLADLYAMLADLLMQPGPAATVMGVIAAGVLAGQHIALDDTDPPHDGHDKQP